MTKAGIIAAISDTISLQVGSLGEINQINNAYSQLCPMLNQSTRSNLSRQSPSTCVNSLLMLQYE